MALTHDITITQGKTFIFPVRWGKKKSIIYKAITAVLQKAPLRLMVTGHGIPDGWPAAISGVKGMIELNVKDPNRVRDYEFHDVTVIDVNTIEINDINAAGFHEYVSGGYLQYHEPVDLTGFDARGSIKDKAGVEMLPLTTANTRLVIDLTTKTTTIRIAATDTALLTGDPGDYEVEMVSGDVPPVVTQTVIGSVTVAKEIAT